MLDTAQPHTVRRIIDSYTPQVVPPRLWERIGPAVRALMHQLDLDSMHVARTDLPMVVAYVGRTVSDGRWTPEDGGWPPFDRHLIDGHCNQHVTGTLKSKGRTRTALYRVSKMLHPEQWATGPDIYGRSDVLAPYTPDEMAALVRHATNLRTVRGDVVPLAIIAVGRGAGLHAPDYRATWATDVHIVKGVAVVDVGPPKPRRVPLLTGWAELALDTADALHDRLLTGGTLTTRHNLVSKAAERFNRGCPVRLHATRLRHTWMLDLLERGTPVDLITQAAGISHLHTIERLLERVAPRPADQTVAWLTGTRP